MFKTIRNAWKLPELRRKLLFVIFALLIFRVGAAIPVPYINTEYLQDYIAANSGTIFGLLNTLSGSALSQATLFALSIQPYINASIIIQLLTIAIPALERLAKDGGEEGKKKIQSITRYATLAIGLLQGWGYYTCLLYTSDAADELDGVDLGGRRIIKKKFFQAEDGIRDQPRSRGLGDVYKRQFLALIRRTGRRVP